MSTNQKLSPRQKMINVMYIVFLAMVALSVSGESLSDPEHADNGTSMFSANGKGLDESGIGGEKGGLDGLGGDSRGGDAVVEVDKDIHVNQLSAFVIPTSRNVLRGSRYEAQIVMAAVDSTHTPKIFIDGKPYESQQQGYYSIVTSREGIHSIKGHLEVLAADGALQQLPFETSYFVSEPMATVSNTMMNVMYAGIDNPVSISVPGIASSQISATMSNGTLTRQGNTWIAKPTTVGKDAEITVTAKQDGRTSQVAQMSFRVRRLPDPTPYIVYTDASGTQQQYKGGVPISKNALLNTGKLYAAIDDGLLNVEFKVKSFRVDIFDQMGNVMPEDSQTADFSERQLQKLRNLQKGKTFFITRVKAIGPDGIERTLSPIEIILN